LQDGLLWPGDTASAYLGGQEHPADFARENPVACVVLIALGSGCMKVTGGSNP
jgi:hypothetical protein